MKFGYARTTIGEQNLAIQLDALESAGAETIFRDVDISGSAVLKPAYGDLLRTAKPDDEIIIWRLDRLSRSLITLMTELQLLASLKLRFRSLKEEINSSGTQAQGFYQTINAFKTFERDVMAERAQSLGSNPYHHKAGRPPVISDEKWQLALELMTSPNNMAVTHIAKMLNVSRQAIYKRLSKS